MTWGEISDDLATWTMPGERSPLANCMSPRGGTSRPAPRRCSAAARGWRGKPRQIGFAARASRMIYAGAAQDFQAAANLVSAGELLVRSRYLKLGGAPRRQLSTRRYRVGRSLEHRERMLDPDHPGL